MNLKELRAFDWPKKIALTSHMLDFKVVTRVQITNRAFEISSMLTFCDVFSCTLLTSNNMFSLAIWRQWTLVIILKTTRARAIFLYLKNYACLLTPNCTRNHVITYTNVDRMLTCKHILWGWHPLFPQTVSLNKGCSILEEISERRIREGSCKKRGQKNKYDLKLSLTCYCIWRRRHQVHFCAQSCCHLQVLYLILELKVKILL